MNKYLPETHQYFINDIEVPSITQLVPKPNFMVSMEQLEAARIEGVENHSKIKMFWDTGDTFNDPYLIALQEWLNKEKLGKPVIYETPLFNETHMFGGTPDIVYNDRIIEVKRSFGNSKERALQIAGQALLVGSLSDKWLVVMYDGKQFKSRNVYNENAIPTFIALVKKYWLEKDINNYFKTKVK